MQLRSLVAVFALTASLATGCTGSQRAGQTNAGPIGRPIVDAGARPIDRAALRAKLADRRKLTFDRFLAYRDGRVYPVNDTGEPVQHVWIDAQGNLCAAATLISGDWGRDATIAAVAGNNHVRLADVKTGALEDWILTSGLTHHELVAIQVPGWQPRRPIDVEPPSQVESERLYTIYLDVERQLTSMWDESLDDAVDRLLAHPVLARQLLADRLAGPAGPAAPIVIGFATPPPEA